jgi:hypothetical protein
VWVEVVEPIIESARSPRCLARPLDFIAFTPAHADASPLAVVVVGHFVIPEKDQRARLGIWL